MSYVTDGGRDLAGVGNMLGKFKDVIPGWGYAGRKLEAPTVSGSDKLKAGLAVAAGVVAVLLLVLGLPIAAGMAQSRKAKSGMVGQWLGARHPDEVRLTDLGRAEVDMRHDTFLGSGVGPEFVEQPNYVLGNEDMLRTALSKYNRLKAQGAQVSDWKTFWAAYKAENSDDLDASLYDFGDGFDNKKLSKASLGR